MIIVKYKGGLGNQMFQYVMQKVLQEVYSEEEVKADLSHYMLQNEHNGFELDSVFGFQEPIASRKEVLRAANTYFPGKIYLFLPEKIRRKIAGNLQYKIIALKKKIWSGKNRNFYWQKFHNTYEAEIFSLDLSHDWYLEGLWQNILYWTKGQKSENVILEKIQEMFILDDTIYLNDSRLREVKLQLEKENSVGIHVRRGDFANSKFDICPLEYYCQAIKRIQEKIKNPNFYFFTDDAKYVKQVFPNLEEIKDRVTKENIQIVTHGTERSDIDMWLMSKCSNLIISNSTFSYWGAILGKQKREIIAPKYSVKSEKGEFELSAPENWILLDNIHI